MPVAEPGELVTSIGHFVVVVGKRIVSNFPAYLSRRIPSVLAVPTIPGTSIDNVFWLVLIVGLGVLGLVELWRRLPIATLYLGCVAAILLVWPYSLPRFLAPVIPLMVLTLFLGLWRLVRGWKTVPALAVLSSLGLVLTVSGFSPHPGDLATMARCDRSAPYVSEGCYTAVERGFFAAAFQAEREAPLEAAFLSPKMATLYYLTGRRSIDEQFASRLSAEQLRRHLDVLNVQYILLSRIHVDQKVLGERLGSSCESWELRGEFDGGALLLRRNAHRSEAQARASCEAVTRFATGPW